MSEPKRKFYRVTLSSVEPLQTRLSENQSDTILWAGYADGQSWAIFNAKQVLVDRGYTTKNVESVLVGNNKDGPFTPAAGFPRPA